MSQIERQTLLCSCRRCRASTLANSRDRRRASPPPVLVSQAKQRFSAGWRFYPQPYPQHAIANADIWVGRPDTRAAAPPRRQTPFANLFLSQERSGVSDILDRPHTRTVIRKAYASNPNTTGSLRNDAGDNQAHSSHGGASSSVSQLSKQSLLT